MLEQLNDWKESTQDNLQKSRIRKILVPVDGSKCSINAVKFAVDLAEKYSSEICLFHVVHNVYVNLSGEGLIDRFDPIFTIEELEEEGERLLSSVLTLVREAGVEARAQLDYGSPANKIVHFAKEENFDLIVVGSTGRGVLSRLFFGSVSDKVVHRAPCPVLVVKSRGKENGGCSS